MDTAAQEGQEEVVLCTGMESERGERGGLTRREQKTGSPSPPNRFRQNKDPIVSTPPPHPQPSSSPPACQNTVEGTADCKRLTSLPDSTRTWSYSLSATRNMMEVTFSKQWIHFLLSERWPPTSTILQAQHPGSHWITA